MTPLRYLSLFAGIEGIGLGLEQAGMRCVGQVEIDKFCTKVLARRYPDVPRWPDVRTFARDGNVPAADVVCGGVPCQDLSVAGKRAGLGGARSGLFFEFVRIVDRVAPSWVLFENVPGLLSSKQAEGEGDASEPDDALFRYHAGEDFAVVLGELTGFRPAVPVDGWRTAGLCIGPKRSAAWRVCDAQYFGVAQRRRRVFVVCHARAERAGAVLLEREGGAGDPPPVREPRKDPAGDVGGGAPDRRGLDDYIPEVAYAIRSSQEKQNGSPERGDVTLVAMAVDGSDVANTLKRDDGFVSEDGTGRQPGFVVEQPFVFEPRLARNGRGRPESVVPPLKAQSGSTGKGDSAPIVVTREIASTLSSGSHPNSAMPSRHREDDDNLVATYDVQPPSTRDARNALEGKASTVAGALTSSGGSRRGDRGTMAVYRKARRAANHDDAESWVPDEIANTVNTFDQGDVRATTIIAEPELRVRRLTVTEQERLQGFPDGWTCLCGVDPYSSATCTCPDGPRVAAIGNAVAVPVAAWIGRRFVEQT